MHEPDLLKQAPVKSTLVFCPFSKMQGLHINQIIKAIVRGRKSIGALRCLRGLILVASAAPAIQSQRAPSAEYYRTQTISCPVAALAADSAVGRLTAVGPPLDSKGPQMLTVHPLHPLHLLLPVPLSPCHYR